MKHFFPSLQTKNKLNDFAELLLACMKTGEIQRNHNLIIFLKIILRQYSGNLTISNIEFLLTQILPYLVGKNRTEVEASIAFLIVFIKSLPAPLVANHLPIIVSRTTTTIHGKKIKLFLFLSILDEIHIVNGA